MRARPTRWRKCGARIWMKGQPPLSEMRIIAVGRLGRSPEAELFTRYATRLRPQPSLVEIAEGRGNATEIKRREADAILAALPTNVLLVALDLGGEAPDSAQLAVRLAHWLESGRPLCFAIGGAEGLDARVLAHAQSVLSLGPL